MSDADGLQYRSDSQGFAYARACDACLDLLVKTRPDMSLHDAEDIIRRSLAAMVDYKRKDDGHV